MTRTPQRVEARAPTRIDLAGGTIDLWPLHLLHDDPLTVNVAIDLCAIARIERISSGGIELISVDRGARARIDPAGHGDAAAGGPGGELEFPLRLARHFLAPRPAGAGAWPSCRITTEARVPAGSGLGGSSALGIALTAALDRFTGRGLAPERMLHLTRAIETQVLRIPTGEQDYHPALVGGALALHYTVEGTRVERLQVDLESLRDDLVLVDSGVSRSSGISNWDVLKRHLDGERVVIESLERVNRAAHALREALLANDREAAGRAIGEEWAARKRLSPEVTNEAVDRLIEAGCAAGALAGKVCGAGGGGCLVLWARKGRGDAIRERLRGLGGNVLDYRFSSAGVAVTES